MHIVYASCEAACVVEFRFSARARPDPDRGSMFPVTILGPGRAGPLIKHLCVCFFDNSK